VAASAIPGAAAAPRTAAANIHLRAREGFKLAKKATDRAEIVIFPCFLLRRQWRQVIRRKSRFHGSSLPISLGSAISATFIARLIKGCRVDVRAGYLISEIA
jgi:hypothetical protein